MPRIHTLLQRTPDGNETTVRGWVRTRRDSKDVCFIEVNDGSCLRNLQVIIDLSNAEPIAEELARAHTGASVEIVGTLVESPGKNQTVELRSTSLRVIGDAPQESYPLQKKRHSFEFLREIAHLRPRTNTFGAVARVRNTLSYAIHTFFQERDFVYVHTPIITTSDSEGAGEMFQVTTLPLDRLPAQSGTIDYEQDFFGRRTALTVSGQLEAEIYALALRDVYTFGPTFRAENSNTTRHLAEFWMIEPEMAFCDIHGNMDVAEEFLKYLFTHVLSKCREDMEFFDKWVQPGVLSTMEKIVESKFTRITYTTAVDELKKASTDFEFTPEWGKDLQSEHEKYLTEVVYKGPVIVTDYPREIKAFYMKQNDDGKTVRGMDVLVPRLGEIIGGSERESDLAKLETRMKEMGLPLQDYWWYLELRKFGSAPHAGFGLGFERLVQYVTGMQNIRDVIPFPRTVKNAEF